MHLENERATGESYYKKFSVGEDGDVSSANTLDDVDIPAKPSDWKLKIDGFSKERTKKEAGV